MRKTRRMMIDQISLFTLIFLLFQHCSGISCLELNQGKAEILRSQIVASNKAVQNKKGRIKNLYPNRTHRQLKNPRKSDIYWTYGDYYCHSNSIVAGGLLVQSYSTLFTPGTSFTILSATLVSTGHGSSAAEAVMKSVVTTARSAIA